MNFKTNNTKPRFGAIWQTNKSHIPAIAVEWKRKTLGTLSPTVKEFLEFLMDASSQHRLTCYIGGFR